MKKAIFTGLMAAAIFLCTVGESSAQGSKPFTLQQSIEYALQNKATVANARLQQDIAKARVGEIRSLGLPQINGAVDLGNNFIQQQSLIDPSVFAGPTLNPFVITPQQVASGQPITLEPTYTRQAPAEGGRLVPISFVVPYTGSATVTASQLLFDGSYLIGLKAAQTYLDLSRKQTVQTETEVTEAVTKAYYGALVNRERLNLLDQNLERLQNLLNETEQIYKQGFAEKLDVDRLQVSFNNLKVEKQRASRLVELSEGLLKFQMGLNQQEEIQLVDVLHDIMVDMAKTDPEKFDYSQRIEYSVLETQRDLALLDIRNQRAGYLPRLSLNARYGYNGAGRTLGSMLDIRAGQNNTTDRNWFDFGYVGVSLQIPIFDGLRKKYLVDQAKLTLKTTENGFKILEESIDLEQKQAAVNLKNALEVLDSQKASLELAEEVARVTRIKFQEGVGTNLEVINAETSLREAQTNYYVALYDAVIAKVDLDKATGTLLK